MTAYNVYHNYFENQTPIPNNFVPSETTAYSFDKSILYKIPALTSPMVNLIKTDVYMKNDGLRNAIIALEELISREKATELNFLNQYADYADLLGNLNFNQLYSKDDWSNIVKSFNILLNNRANLERTLNLIEESKTWQSQSKGGEGTGKRRLDITRSFPSYLEKAVKNSWNPSVKSSTQARKIVLEALTYMADAETNAETGQKQRAFEKYRNLLESEKDTSQFEQLNLLVDEIIKVYFDDKDKSKIGRGTKKKDAYKIISQKDTGGASTVQEAAEAAVLNAFGLVSGYVNGEAYDMSYEAIRTGQTLQKADNILFKGDFTIEIENLLLQNFGVTDKSERSLNIDRWRQLSQLLKKADNQLVFISDKNYSVSFKNFEGFAAQSSTNLNNLQGMLGAIGADNVEEIIFVLANTKNNAINDDIEPIRKYLSSKIADFLFDDVSFIAPSGNSLGVHLMNLSGVYMPLSFILESTYRGLKQIDQISQSNQMVKISFSPGPAYDGPKDHKLKEEDWTEFRKERMEKTTLAIHFFSGFSKTILDIMGGVF